MIVEEGTEPSQSYSGRVAERTAWEGILAGALVILIFVEEIGRTLRYIFRRVSPRFNNMLCMFLYYTWYLSITFPKECRIMVSFGLMTYRVCIFLEKHCLVRQLYASCMLYAEREERPRTTLRVQKSYLKKEGTGGDDVQGAGQ